MITLFCDLDNTIIYSHRKILNTSKRVAEMLNGVEQSYITERTFEYLSSCWSVSFVPVTTRTPQQYERVESTIESFNCKYALILNGAVLLNNGIVDDLWLDDSKELVKGSAEEMGKAITLLQQYGKAPLRYRDEFLIYSSVQEPKVVVEKMKNDIDGTQVNLFFDNRKVYCTPSTLTKGNAIKRLMIRLMPELSFAVGDSENDLSMFENVDVPVVPNALAGMVSNPNKVIVPNEEILSDAACDVIEKVTGKKQVI